MSVPQLPSVQSKNQRYAQAEAVLDVLGGSASNVDLEDTVSQMISSIGGIDALVGIYRRRLFEAAQLDDGGRQELRIADKYLKMVLELAKLKSYDRRTDRELLATLPEEQLRELFARAIEKHQLETRSPLPSPRDLVEADP